MSIQQIVNEANQILARAQQAGQLSKRVLAVGIEINQRYSEYLEQLETADLHIQTGITVTVDGKTIRFQNDNDFSEWLAENIT
jgi:hypothetical protein